jgi:hypothetical protein
MRMSMVDYSISTYYEDLKTTFRSTLRSPLTRTYPEPDTLNHEHIVTAWIILNKHRKDKYIENPIAIFQVKVVLMGFPGHYKQVSTWYLY